ncbi:phage protein [Listeria monocytogenes F6900]|nr:phage protein [Listeria monocytogenes FSL N3-165]EEW20835.1 phage protein [Listeria monocytogenes F6900]EFF97586.1 phage protein [Listeria monocytogenes J2818]
MHLDHERNMVQLQRFDERIIDFNYRKVCFLRCYVVKSYSFK